LTAWFRDVPQAEDEIIPLLYCMKVLEEEAIATDKG